MNSGGIAVLLIVVIGVIVAIVLGTKKDEGTGKAAGAEKKEAAKTEEGAEKKEADGDEKKEAAGTGEAAGDEKKEAAKTEEAAKNEPAPCVLGEWIASPCDDGDGLQMFTRTKSAGCAESEPSVKYENCDVDCVLGEWYTYKYPNGQVCNNATKKIQERRDIVVSPKHGGAPCGERERTSPCPEPKSTDSYSGPFKVHFTGGNQSSSTVRVVPADDESKVLGTATLTRRNSHTFNASNWPGRIKVLIGLNSRREVDQYGVDWPLTREAGDRRVITNFPANREESMGNLIPTLYFSITD